MDKKKILLVLIVVVSITGIGVLSYYLLKNKGDNAHIIESTETSLKAKAVEESGEGKGKRGSWGEGQEKYIQHLIATSLLKTQVGIVEEEMDVGTFIGRTQKCLDCITKNFSDKYDYDYVVKNIEASKGEKDFTTFFKSLYNTCDCNDQLGKILVELLKAHWKSVSEKKHPEKAERISECIDRIQVPKTWNQEEVSQIYNYIESCVFQT